MRKRKITGWYIAIVVILVIAALYCIYPVWYTLVCSFSSKEYISAGQVWIWPKGFHIASYKKILEDITFLKTTWVSVKRVLINVPLQLITLLMVTFPLYLPRKVFPAGKYIMWFFLANMYFSGGMIPSYMLMKDYGLFDSFWALVLPAAFPVGNLVLMINFFRTIPFELYEASEMDGANPLQMLWKIYVPLSKPAIATFGLFAFVGQWNAYFDGLIYINDLDKQPLQTYVYQLSVKLDYSTMTADEIIEALQTSNQSFNSAKVFVAMVPILIVYPFLQKYFTKGMVIGAVKG